MNGLFKRILMVLGFFAAIGLLLLFMLWVSVFGLAVVVYWVVTGAGVNEDKWFHDPLEWIFDFPFKISGME